MRSASLCGEARAMGIGVERACGSGQPREAGKRQHPVQCIFQKILSRRSFFQPVQTGNCVALKYVCEFSATLSFKMGPHLHPPDSGLDRVPDSAGVKQAGR